MQVNHPGRFVLSALVSVILFVGLGVLPIAAQYHFAQPLDDSPALKGALPARPATPVPAGNHTYPRQANRQGYAAEVEPNGTFGTATPLPSTNLVVRATIFPTAPTDIDFYSFTATAGDRVYAAVMTSFSAGNSTDSQLTLLASDGTTQIEFDDDDGTMAGLSSSIAGAVIPSNGTYYLRVNDFTAGTRSAPTSSTCACRAEHRPPRSRATTRLALPIPFRSTAG